VASNRLDVLMHHIRGLVGSPRDGDSDAALLTAFVSREDEQAFAVLMRRYGSLVWRACLRAAGQEQDAEDVFQATFLMLSRKAGTIRKKDSLSSWLFGVARRLAIKQKTAAARRRKHEGRVIPPAPIDNSGELTWREMRTVLDEELAKLPDKYRAPLLLCYYQGLTQEEAANQLGWNKRSVKDRLERGRKQLCRRLTRRGLTLSAALTGSMLASHASAAPVPATLAAVTFRTAIQYGLGQPVIGAASAPALALANSALKALFVTKALTVAVGMLAVLTIGGAGVVVGHGAFSQPTPKPPPKVAAALPPIPRVQPPAPQRQKDLVDLFGDPLPPGAVARLGTVRFRTGGTILGGIGVLPDNNTLVSASDGGGVRFWDAKTGKLLREIGTDPLLVRSFALAPNGKYFAVAGNLPREPKTPTSRSVGIWNTATGRQIQTLTRADQDGEAPALAFTEDGELLASMGESGLLRIEKVVAGEELFRHQFEPRSQVGLAFSIDGSTVAVSHDSSPRRKLSLWKWQSGGDPLELQVTDKAGSCLAFSPDGNLLAEAGYSMQVVRVWDVASGRLLHTLQPPVPDSHRTHAVAFAPDGKTLLASTKSVTDSAVHIWDTATWKHLKTLEPGADSLAISRDSRLLTCLRGRALAVWDLTSGKQLAANDEAHLSAVTQLAVAGNVIASGDRQTIRFWDGSTGKHLAKLDNGGDPVGAIALAPDGKKLVSASNWKNAVYLWDAATGALIFELPGHGKLGVPGSLGFAADGKHFFSWGTDRSLRQWDVVTGKCVLEKTVPPDATDPKQNVAPMIIGPCAFSRSGDLLVLSPGNKTMAFDVATGKRLFEINSQGGSVVSQALSPDGRLLLDSSRGKTSVAQLPDGRMQLSAEKTNLICLWELSTRQLRKQIILPDGGAGPVTFSPDSKLFAAAVGAPQRQIRVWDTANGKEIARIKGFQGNVVSLAFAAGSTRLISGMDDTTALVWDLALKH
jgi:RNA polymerase sigma factor (sigma-70 family)